jgi:ribosomal RNA methyltransferase Nop2
MIAQRKDTRQGRNKMTSKVSKPRRNEPIKKKQLHVDTDSDEHSSNESIVESEEDYDVDIDDASSSVGDQDNSNDDDSDSSQGKQNNYFTDENSSWLKPKNKKVEKKQLLSSSDDDISDGVVGENGEENSEDFSSDDDEEEDDDGGVEDLLEIERESRLLDKQLAQEEEEAEIELRKMIESSSNTFRLPTTEEIQEEIDGTRVIPPSEIRDRINNIITVLSDFKNRREPNRSRSDYITQLTSDLAELYGYLPDLVEYFLTMFNPSETLEFLEASDSTRPMVIRTNTLKTRRKDLAAALLKRGVTLDPLASWSKVGLKITASTIPIGATPEYLSGHYMLQSAASFCPVLALNPSPSGNEVVLDMSSAPGGKTSYLAQLMRNTGLIIANDLRPERQKATVANMHRLGVRNVITCCHDGRVLGKLWKNRFTKILLDAPCSGLGVISRDPSVKLQRTIKDVDKCAVLQKELLLSAIDALNYKGKDCGIMVYSTCSVSVTENEEVINYLLQKRDVKLLDTGLDFGK